MNKPVHSRKMEKEPVIMTIDLSNQAAEAMCRVMLTRYPPTNPAEILATLWDVDLVRYFGLAGIFMK